MTKPNECKWCGCGVRSHGVHVVFQCWTVLIPDYAWSQSPECKLRGIEDRIRRAIEAIRAANRYCLHPLFIDEVALIPDETGNLTQACVLDDVAAILEGVSDDETK